MRKSSVRFIVLLIILLPAGFLQAAETLVLYDNFNAALINPDKWIGGEFGAGREALRVIQNSQLRMMARGYGNTSSDYGVWNWSDRLNFMEPTNITIIKATVSLAGFQAIGCNSNPNYSSGAAAYITGYFFNTGTPIPGNATNDIRARIGIQAYTNTSVPPQNLQATAYVSKCTNSDCTTTIRISSKDLGTVSLSQKVTLYIKWDKLNHRFIFQRDAQPKVYAPYDVVKYPDTSPPGINAKRLEVRGDAANCTELPRAVGFTDAFFDNVYINQ
jgi:hypothetical protein